MEPVLDVTSRAIDRQRWDIKGMAALSAARQAELWELEFETISAGRSVTWEDLANLVHRFA